MALYVFRYRMARAKMVCAAPGVPTYNDLQLARHVGARSEISAARAMGGCAPLNIKNSTIPIVRSIDGRLYLTSGRNFADG